MKRNLSVKRFSLPKVKNIRILPRVIHPVEKSLHQAQSFRKTSVIPRSFVLSPNFNFKSRSLRSLIIQRKEKSKNEQSKKNKEES